MGRLWMVFGGIYGLLTVLLGAFGAHALKDVLTPDLAPIYDTATKYMMFHALALLALGLWAQLDRWVSTFWSGVFFSVGTFIFSGSLYAIVFTGERWLGMITPLGGTGLILGWLLFIYSIARARSRFI